MSWFVTCHKGSPFLTHHQTFVLPCPTCTSTRGYRFIVNASSRMKISNDFRVVSDSLRRGLCRSRFILSCKIVNYPSLSTQFKIDIIKLPPKLYIDPKTRVTYDGSLPYDVSVLPSSIVDSREISYPKILQFLYNI